MTDISTLLIAIRYNIWISKLCHVLHKTPEVETHCSIRISHWNMHIVYVMVVVA